MKNKISYIVMSIIFFNILFLFYFYFKIVNFLYFDLFYFESIIGFLVVNLFMIILDIIYIVLFNFFVNRNSNYLFVAFVGTTIGFFVSFFVLRKENYKISDYLSIISYFLINTIFLSYSLYFEKKQKNSI